MSNGSVHKAISLEKSYSPLKRGNNLHAGETSGAPRRDKTAISTTELVPLYCLRCFQDIPIFNGIVHVLGSSVLRPDIEALATNIAFWQCTHQFCFECPLLTPFLLKFLDKIGIITTMKPFDFSPPPGVRPDWVSFERSSDMRADFVIWQPWQQACLVNLARLFASKYLLLKEAPTTTLVSEYSRVSR